jgi:hypothetical protein
MPFSPNHSYGDLFSAALCVFMGIWQLYIWPRGIRRLVVRGKLSEEDAQARLRMLPPKSGYILFLLAIALTGMWLFQNAFFRGMETVVGVLVLAFSLGLIAFALWRIRKANR